MKQRAYKTALIVSVALAAILIACGDGLPPEFPCPEFTLKSPMTKAEVSRKAIEGKPAIIYWFTSW